VLPQTAIDRIRNPSVSTGPLLSAKDGEGFVAKKTKCFQAQNVSLKLTVVFDLLYGSLEQKLRSSNLKGWHAHSKSLFFSRSLEY